MDRFTGASMDQSADPHSAPESGDLLAALRVTRPLSISTHLPVFCDRPLDCVGLSKLVMAHIFREDTQPYVSNPFQCVKPYQRGEETKF